MEILIISRNNIEELSLRPFKKATTLICITDFDYTFANLKYEPQYLLQMTFDDVPVGDGFFEEKGRTLSDEEIASFENKYSSITAGRVEQIICFYNSVKDSAEVLICQCEHGQSISAAIVAATKEFESGSGIDIFASDLYYPNKSVYRKVVKYLNKYKIFNFHEYFVYT